MQQLTGSISESRTSDSKRAVKLSGVAQQPERRKSKRPQKLRVPA
jgi:hypothetical protein